MGEQNIVWSFHSVLINGVAWVKKVDLASAHLDYN